MKKPYQFQFSPNAEAEFALLERALQKRIINKLSFFEKSGNPLSFAKRLQAASQYWRFRVGDYRIIISEKDQTELIILLVLKVGHRREVYD